MNPAPFRVLVPFNTAVLYGMERAVIESFDAVRPDIEPCFVITNTAISRGLPVVGELRRRGLECRTFSDRGDWPRIGIPRSPLEGVRMMLALWRGNQDILRASKDCHAIYLPSIAYAAFALAAMIVFRFRGRPVFHHFHDLTGQGSLRMRAFNLLITGHFHNTHAGKDAVLSDNPFLRRRRNAVASCCVQMRTSVRESAEITGSMRDSRNIVYLGRLERRKGVFLLLQAFASLAEQHPDVRLHLVGGADSAEGPELQTALCDPRLKDRVVLWGWRGDSNRILEHACIHVQPSLPGQHDESFGRSAAEAMAMGVPTVCFRSGVLPEVVGDGIAGLVCSQPDPSSLAAAMSRLLQDPHLQQRLSYQARRRWEDHFSPMQARRRWLRCLLQEEAA
ncbi:MAG: glycosyltransferase family 4 protein [Bryobacteraceae bacterium]